MSAPLPFPVLSDAEARRRAATAFDRNLVIEAGAGTGKTALLVERALNLLAGAGVPMREMAAITFSEKAAAELRERLARGLEELRALARKGTPTAPLTPDTEARRSYLWLLGRPGADAGLVERRALEALEDLDSASVSTLHAFCADILRRHPREAGVDPAFAIDEGPSFRALFEEEWDAFLGEELGPGAPRAAVWRSALAVPGALVGVASLAAALASFRLPGEAAEPAAGAQGLRRALLGDVIGPLLTAIGDLLRRAHGLNPNMEHFLNLSVHYLDGVLERGPGALAAIEDEWTLADYLKKTPTPGQRLSGCDAGEVEATAAQAKRLVAALSRVDEEAISDITRAAAPLALRARERLLAAGFVSFDGLLRLTRELLANDPATRHALGARHRVILVDEFQDTDPLQYDILFFLA
ncbi:MAG TPA: UvrD-helicase domain-containing protein, partial [Candidatus Polarisedimenticolia bacterium]|nr:UvrD-helicase domain-containing protein [Candidatus Polarisedimenticolia bacterium]